MTLLCDALVRLVVALHHLDGPTAVIHVDLAPGFVSRMNTSARRNLGFPIEVGQIELSRKLLYRRYLKTGLLCPERRGSHVAELWLDVATVRLNLQLQIQGFRR